MWPILSLKKHQLKPKKLAKIIAKAAGRPTDHICHYLGYLSWCNQYLCKDTEANSPASHKIVLWNSVGENYYRDNLWLKGVFIFWEVDVWLGELGYSKQV